MNKLIMIILVSVLFLAMFGKQHAFGQVLERESEPIDIKELKKEYYSNFSHWFIGADFGLPFYSGDISSFSKGKTYLGNQYALFVGYQFNPLLGLKLSGRYGNNKAASMSHSLNYILGNDGMTYYPPTTIQGTVYKDIYSQIKFFSAGMHLGINLNQLFSATQEERLLTVILEPAIYMQKFSSEVRLKDGNSKLGIDIPNSINLGLGSDLFFRFRVSRLVDTQVGGGIVYINSNDFDGIKTIAKAHDSYMWSVNAGITFKLNNKKYKDNIIYAAFSSSRILEIALAAKEKELTKVRNKIDSLKVIEPCVIVE